MVEKNRKLQNQFEAEASTSSHGGSASVLTLKSELIFLPFFVIPSEQLESLSAIFQTLKALRTLSCHQP